MQDVTPGVVNGQDSPPQPDQPVHRLRHPGNRGPKARWVARPMAKGAILPGAQPSDISRGDAPPYPPVRVARPMAKGAIVPGAPPSDISRGDAPRTPGAGPRPAKPGMPQPRKKPGVP